MPFYQVDQEGAKARLVRADNPSQALKHVSASVFKVSGALSPDEIADLMADGVKREIAGDSAPAPADDKGGQQGDGKEGAPGADDKGGDDKGK